MVWAFSPLFELFSQKTPQFCILHSAFERQLAKFQFIVQQHTKNANPKGLALNF